MPSFERDGLNLHYHDEGQGTPIVLLHAFPLTAESFRPQVAALSDRYRFILPDHRGFGESELGAGSMEMSTLGKDVLALLDHLGLERAIVGGVSMGGYAIMALLREDPSRIQAIILADTQARADDEAGRAKREETAEAVLARGVGVLADTMPARLLAQPPDPEVRAEVIRLIHRNTPRGIAAALRGMAHRGDAREILARYAGPALVVVGEEDSVTPPERARELQSLIAGSSLVTIPKAGHLSNLESPDAFNRAIDAFLSSLPS